MKKINTLTVLLVAGAVLFGCSCNKKSSSGVPEMTAVKVSSWMTTPDKSQLLAPQPTVQFSDNLGNGTATITVDESQKYQTIDGFGYCLTDNSAIMLDTLTGATQDSLLKELFSPNGNGIGVSYLRLPMGAAGLSTHSYTFDDLASGTDYPLDHFSLQPDMQYVIPLLKKIIAINPNLTMIATPWSPPAWMKTNNSLIGGNLNTAAYASYANYFVKYIQAMNALGINIAAVTPQNEPNNTVHDPSMGFPASDEAAFIGNNLGPAFKAAGLTTKIICFDHNPSTPQYPDTVLSNTKASPYIDGTAFHLYEGDVTTLSQIHDAFAGKNIYFTEQYTSVNRTFADLLQNYTKNIIIGTTRNWSKNVIEWNLAADPNLGPKQADACPDCLPAITIAPAITRNVAYYLIAHAAKFVRPGAVRIASNIAGDFQDVAFKNTDGSKVLIVVNTGSATESFDLVWQGKFVAYTLPKGAVATLKW